MAGIAEKNWRLPVYDYCHSLSQSEKRRRKKENWRATLEYSRSKEAHAGKIACISHAIVSHGVILWILCHQLSQCCCRWSRWSESATICLLASRMRRTSYLLSRKAQSIWEYFGCRCQKRVTRQSRHCKKTVDRLLLSSTGRANLKNTQKYHAWLFYLQWWMNPHESSSPHKRVVYLRHWFVPSSYAVLLSLTCKSCLPSSCLFFSRDSMFDVRTNNCLKFWESVFFPWKCWRRVKEICCTRQMNCIFVTHILPHRLRRLLVNLEAYCDTLSGEWRFCGRRTISWCKGEIVVLNLLRQGAPLFLKNLQESLVSTKKSPESKKTMNQKEVYFWRGKRCVVLEAVWFIDSFIHSFEILNVNTQKGAVSITAENLLAEKWQIELRIRSEENARR